VKEGTVINSLNEEEILMKTRKEKGTKYECMLPFLNCLISCCYFFLCDSHLSIICILFQEHHMHDRSRS
jgi:hypothetical protein